MFSEVELSEVCAAVDEKQDISLTSELGQITRFVILNPSISQHFPASATARNVTLTDHSVIYQFQMTASTFLGRVESEGNLSTITPEFTVFVPEPGNYV